MTIEEAKRILTSAITYNKDGSVKKGSWILSTEGIDAIKVALVCMNNAADQDPISRADQQKNDIEKACDLLLITLKELYLPYDFACGIIDNFKKAMEE